MRKIWFSLILGVGIVLAGEQPEFPVTPVNNFETLRSWFIDAPHTIADFAMERTLPSGRVLKSRGTFECRKGMGMMWKTEYPVRNTMVIDAETLRLYDAQGRELRRVSLADSPAGQFSAVLVNELNADFFRQIEKRISLTCRTNKEAGELVLGLKPKRRGWDLKWLQITVSNGKVCEVYYESSRQGKTEVRFRNIRLSDTVPPGPFTL